MNSRASAAEAVVAVDLGGTLTKIAYVARDGTASDIHRVDTLRDEHGVVPPEWLAGLILQTAETRSDLHVVGYGVVVPGIIDMAARSVRVAPNVGWRNIPLGQVLDIETGLPGGIGHDVRAGGLAEWRLGEAAGVDDLLFLALGTGIAGASVVDGRMLQVGGYAGEIGHLHVSVADQHCACGAYGCLETVASAAGVARSYQHTCGVGRSAYEVAELARRGDQAALQAFAVANAGLAEALAAYVVLLAPEVVIIGGGLSGAADLILPEVQQALEDRLSFHRRPRLAIGTLGSDAGVRGAGLLGWDHHLREGR
ncbi:MAG: ROK family protein [Microlunatus sp.]|nr:ROK family protein [Microlunatus sp.]MDN5771564.1 ROK family protein [Microlunatus sp.]MDN5804020.1 ROK family protein [Microlunatus sp.]